MSGGGSSGGQNTTTSQVQIPAYEQAFSQQNQQLAQSLGSQPYPQYGGALIQPMNATQQQGEQQALGASTDYQPYLASASNDLGSAESGQQGVAGSIGQAQG